MIVYTCPRCTVELEVQSLNTLRLYRCRQCDGHALMLTQLRKSIPADRFRAFWQVVRKSAGRGAACPGCRQTMTIVRFDEVEVDVCHPCQFLWMDPGEQEQLAQPTDEQPPPELPPSEPVRAGSPLGEDLPEGRYYADMRGSGGFLQAISNAFQQRRTIRDAQGQPIGRYEAYRSRRSPWRYAIWYSRGLPRERQLTIPMPARGLLTGHAPRSELRCGFEVLVDIQVKSMLPRKTIITHNKQNYRLVGVSALSNRLALKRGRHTVAQVGPASISPFSEHEVVTNVPLPPELVLVLLPLFAGIDVTEN